MKSWRIEFDTGMFEGMTYQEHYSGSVLFDRLAEAETAYEKLRKCKTVEDWKTMSAGYRR